MEKTLSTKKLTNLVLKLVKHLKRNDDNILDGMFDIILNDDLNKIIVVIATVNQLSNFQSIIFRKMSIVEIEHEINERYLRDNKYFCVFIKDEKDKLMTHDTILFSELEVKFNDEPMPENTGVINLSNRRWISQINEPQYVVDLCQLYCNNKKCDCKIRWTYGYSEIVKISNKTIAGTICNPIEMYPFGPRVIKTSEMEFRNKNFNQCLILNNTRYTTRILIKWDDYTTIKIGYKDDCIHYLIIKNNNQEGFKDPSSDYELETNKIFAYKYTNKLNESSLIIDNNGYMSTIVAVHFTV